MEQITTGHFLKRPALRNSLVGQWLGLCTVTAEGPGVILGQGNEIPQAMWHGRKKKACTTVTLKVHAFFIWHPGLLSSPRLVLDLLRLLSIHTFSRPNLKNSELNITVLSQLRGGHGPFSRPQRVIFHKGLLWGVSRPNQNRTKSRLIPA